MSKSVSFVFGRKSHAFGHGNAKDRSAQVPKKNDRCLNMEENTLKQVIASAIEPLHKEIQGVLQVVESLRSEMVVMKSGTSGQPASRYLAVKPRPINLDQPSRYLRVMQRQSSHDSNQIPDRPSARCLKKKTEKSFTKWNPTKRNDARQTILSPINEDQDLQKKGSKFDSKMFHSRKKSRKLPATDSVEVVDNELQTVERKKYILASSFHKNVTKDCIIKFLKKVADFHDYSVENYDALNSFTYNSFVIGVPESLFGTFMKPSIWPQGARIIEWFPVSPIASSIASTSTK